jgi:hypothetical protein
MESMIFAIGLSRRALAVAAFAFGGLFGDGDNLLRDYRSCHLRQ